MALNFLFRTRQLVSSVLVNRSIATTRFLSLTSPSCLKEIVVQKENDVITIEGCYVEDSRKGNLLEPKTDEQKQFCPLCPNRLDTKVKYTDVLILSQFMRADGCVLPRRATGLCATAQRRLQRMVHQAQRAGLMPEFRPDRRDGSARTLLHNPYKWRKYKAYFVE